MACETSHIAQPFRAARRQSRWGAATWTIGQSSSTSSAECAIAGASVSPCAARWSSLPARCSRCCSPHRASNHSASALPPSSRSACCRSPCSSASSPTDSSGRCAGASPTRRSRCISRSATRRSKLRLSARSRRPPRVDRRRIRRAWSRNWSSVRWTSAGRSGRGGRSSALPSAGTARCSRRLPRWPRSSSPTAPPICATACRRCSSSRAAQKRRARTASR
jgi:hypothetical protein